MVEIISVRFKEGGKHYYFNPNGAQFQPGEGVIVETTRGTEFGECVQGNTPIDEMELTAPLRPVLRRATPEEMAEILARGEDVDRCIAYHKALKCEYAGTGSMPRHFVERGEEGFVDFAKRASKVAEKLQDAGQHFLYHNHAFELAHYSKGRGLEILFNETSPAFQFEIDVFWIQAGGMNPIDWIHKVAGRMDVVHFKDMKPTCTITEIGNGNLDWPKIMAACDEIGVKYAFIEQDNAVESDPLNCMKISHDYLAPLGAKF